MQHLEHIEPTQQRKFAKHNEHSNHPPLKGQHPRLQQPRSRRLSATTQHIIGIDAAGKGLAPSPGTEASHAQVGGSRLLLTLEKLPAGRQVDKQAAHTQLK